jgi:phage shock protein E
MDWISILVVIGIVLLFVGIKQLGSISPEAARKHLRQGAKVIDVRSPQELQSGHLPGAVNIPGSAIEAHIARYAPNKETVLLLHCLSGGRSGLAVQMLKKLGYKNAFNLGSYGRAEKIVTGVS